MYARPSLNALALDVAAASCCTISVDEILVANTGLCRPGQPFFTCRLTPELCVVSVGPLTISGQPSSTGG